MQGSCNFNTEMISFFSPSWNECNLIFGISYQKSLFNFHWNFFESCEKQSKCEISDFHNHNLHFVRLHWCWRRNSDESLSHILATLSTKKRNVYILANDKEDDSHRIIAGFRMLPFRITFIWCRPSLLNVKVNLKT